MRSESLSWPKSLLGVRVLLIASTGFLGMMGCGGPSEELQREVRLGQLTRLLDERRYDDVIEGLEGVAPDRETQLILAQAHLGRSGFEPIRFAASVVAAQATDAPGGGGNAAAQAQPCPQGRIDSAATFPKRCWLSRIVAHLPDPDHPDLERARSILRLEAESGGGDPASGRSVEFFAGLVETISAVARGAKVVRLARGLDPERIASSEADALLEQADRTLDEASRALIRARRTYRQIGAAILGAGEVQVPLVGQGNAVDFAEETGIPLLRAAIQWARADAAPRVDQAAEFARRIHSSVIFSAI